MMPGRFGFLVTGTSRSGTSLLTALLGSHPEIQVGVERHYEHLAGLVPETAATVATRLSGFRTACEQEAERQTKIWGNELTTEHIGALTGKGTSDDEDAIEPFFSALAELKHIFVVRDGRTCIRSKILHDGMLIDFACRSWLFSVKLLRSLRQRGVNAKIVRFEELISSPIPTLQGICDFLGLKYAPQMLEPSERPGRLAHLWRDRDLETTKASPLPTRIMGQIESELQYCGYLNLTQITPPDAGKILDDASLLSDLREEMAVMEQQLAYQTNRRRAEIDEIAMRAREQQQRFSAELGEREERLRNADRDLRNLMREVESREERLRDADRDIRRLMGEISDRDQRLVAADGDLRRLVAELANATRQLQEITRQQSGN